AFDGIAAQRPDLVPGKSIYGSGKDASNLNPGEQIVDYFNRDAFAQPAPGTFGNLPRNAAVGPSFRQIDMAISKLVPFGTQRIELRVETINLFNTFNWGDPVVFLRSSTLGRLTTQAEATPNGDNDHRKVQIREQ